MNQWSKALALSLLCIAGAAHASHMKGGTISWQQDTSYVDPSNNRYVLNVTLYLRASYSWGTTPTVGQSVDALQQLALSGTSWSINHELVMQVTELDLANDLFIANESWAVVVPKSALPVTASILDCCRASDLAEGNHDTNFSLQAVIPAGQITAPYVTMAPKVFLAQGKPSNFPLVVTSNPALFTTWFGLSSTAASGLPQVRPVGVDACINGCSQCANDSTGICASALQVSSSGQVFWTPQDTGSYQVQFTVSAVDATQTVLDAVPVDLNLTVVPFCDGTTCDAPPVISGLPTGVTYVAGGQPFSVPVTVTDARPDKTLALFSDLGGTLSAPSGSTSPASWTLSYDTTGLGSTPLTLCFRAESTDPSTSAVSNSLGLACALYFVVGAPSIASPLDGASIFTTTTTLSGAGGVPGAEISIYEDGVFLVDGGAVASNGTWSATVPLTFGAHSFTATQTKGGKEGPASAAVQLIVGFPPVIGAPTSNATLSNPAVAVSGSGVAGATITLKENSTVLGTTTVAGNGSWSATAQYGSFGGHSVSATQALNGVTSAAASVTFQIQNVPPAITAPAREGTTALTTPISGTGTPGATVSVLVDHGQTPITAIVDGSGNWATAAQTLTYGRHDVSATQKLFGNTSGQALYTFYIDRPTTTAVTSSAASAVFGQTVTFTATVSNLGDSTTPVGMVQFVLDGAPFGAVQAPDASGRCTLTTSALSVGSHTVGATFSSELFDMGYQDSQATPITQTVSAAGSSPALSFTPTSPVYPQAISVTVNVTATAPGSGTPTGTITVTDEQSNVLAGPSALASGSFSFSTTALGIGAHSLTATYSGSGNFTASEVSVPITIGKAVSVTTLSLSSGAVTFGQVVQLTATLGAADQGAGTPDGDVAFYDGSTLLATVTSVAGVASTSVQLPGGTHSLTATYAGSATFAASSSSLASLTVAPAATTLTIFADPSSTTFPASAMIEVTVQSAAGVPTGVVQLSEGIVPLDAIPLDASGAAVFYLPPLPPGSHLLTATYVGDGNFDSSAGDTSETISQALSGLSLVSSAQSLVFGQSVTFTATVAPGARGTVSFSDGSNLLGTVTLSDGAASYQGALSAGSHTITAHYSGDVDFAAADVQLIQTVTKADTTTAITTGPATTLDQPITVTITVAAVDAGAGQPTGTVALNDGATALATLTLDASGQATFTSSSLAVGSHTLTATYQGDADFNSSSGVGSEEVDRISTRLTVTATPRSATEGQTVSLAITVRSDGGSSVPDGVVTLADGDQTVGTVTLVSGAGTFSATLTAGQHVLSATYEGNTVFAPSSQTATVTVTSTSTSTGPTQGGCSSTPESAIGLLTLALLALRRRGWSTPAESSRAIEGLCERLNPRPIAPLNRRSARTRAAAVS